MKLLRDEDLILYYYGEAPNAEEVMRQLEVSAETRRRYESLCSALDAVEEPPIPERSATYAAAVWRQLAPQLESETSKTWSWDFLRPRREWALVGAMAMLVLAAFLVGRFWPQQQAQVAAGLSSDARERILLMTVANHFERSEILLLELVNTAENGAVDLSLERQRAGELRDDSRLYRQAAMQAGEGDLVALLEQLERVWWSWPMGLKEVTSTDLGELRLRLDEGDILFKVRVVGSHLRDKTRIETRPEVKVRAARDA